MRMTRNFMNTTSKFASMGMFDGWMGMGSSSKTQTDAANGDAGAPGGGGGGGGGVVKKKVAAVDGADPGADGANDGTTDDKLVDDIWNEDQGGPKKPGGDPPAATPTVTVQPTQDEQVKTYLKQQGIEPFTLSEQELEAFKSGDGVQAVLDRINGNVVNAHMRAVQASSTLMDSKIKKAVEEAVGTSANLIRDTKARDALQAALPWAKNPTFSKVAETIMGQFLKRSNNDIPKAVTLTKLYFQRQMQEMDPDYQPNTNSGPNNRKARTPFGGSGDTDFVALLTGKN